MVKGKQRSVKRFRGKTAAAIIEFPHDKILLIKRGTTVFRGYWALPGGKVETGETVEEAVLREVKEETGLEIEIIAKIGEYHELGVQNNIEYDYYPTCFLVKPLGNKFVRQENEIEEIKLFDLENIPDQLAFKHFTMIKDYLRYKELIELDKQIRECKKCRLYKSRTHAVPGEGPCYANIMILGQAPGKTEDEPGRPFVGRSGKLLDRLLEAIKLGRNLVFITSCIKCFPPRNRSPRSDELKTCKPYLKKQINLINPQIIITLGNYALHALFEKKSTISQIHGQPQEFNNIKIFPTYHPAAAIRFPKIRTTIKEDFKKLEILLKKP